MLSNKRVVKLMEIFGWALVSYGIIKFAPVISDVAGKVIDLVVK